MIPVAALVVPGHLDRLVPLRTTPTTGTGRQRTPRRHWGWLPDALRSLADYHRQRLHVPQGLHSGAPLRVQRLDAGCSWAGRRPSTTRAPSRASHGCAVRHSCSAAILSVGNPLIWWVRPCWPAGRAALLAGPAGATGAPGPSWRASRPATCPGSCTRSGPCSSSTPSSFEPFLVLALTYAWGWSLGRPPTRRGAGAGRAGGRAVCGRRRCWSRRSSCRSGPPSMIPYQQWRWRMWMPSWI